MARSSPTPIEEHLELALESTEDDTAKYHLREAYQKWLVAADPTDADE